MLRSATLKRSVWMAAACCGALAALLIAGLGEAQDGRSAASTGFAGPPSFADVVADVSPAVVNIAVTKQAASFPAASGGSPFAGAPFDDLLERFGFPGQGRMLPNPQPRQGEGSGFIIDPEGYIATNYHVVEGAVSVVVTLDSGERLDATVVGSDARTDLALLKVENGGNLPALRLGNSDLSRVGDWVLAIGNPFGLGGSATAGIISARGRDIQSGPYDDYLQIDAPINSGNSGGPIFNSTGEVIGINTAIYSPNGGSVGIGFAIPANQARSVLDELRQGGVVSRGWLGVQIESVDQRNRSYAEPDGLGEPQPGALVAAVVAGGPADSAGLIGGDIITVFDGEMIDSARSLSRLVGARDAGDEVELEYLRDGRNHEISTVLGDLDETQAQAALEPIDPDPRAFREFRFPRMEPPARR